MDFKIIINSLIIIFILHIIILNINYNLDIGIKKNKIESFEDKKENSMSFLTNNTDSNDEFKKKLMKYIQQPEPVIENEFEKKNLFPVAPSNTYLSDNNEPNFESNVADIKKFYKINYDNLDESELKSTSIETLNKVVSLENNVSEPCPTQSYGRDSNVNPDTWSYKNELPMNGGNMNGIVGFDTLESQFAIYGTNKLNIQTVDDNKFKNIPHDDLRKPIIYEN